MTDHAPPTPPEDDGALFEQVYSELRKLAAQKIANLRPGGTLQATALVHEVFLRFEGRQLKTWDGPGHLFFAAARAMRDILVEHIRKKDSLKRGGGWKRLPIELANLEVEVPHDDLEALHEALTNLAQDYPDHARLVELRYFTGMQSKEAAEVLEISPATYSRRWRFAWAWLRDHMGDSDSP